jgi:hypothetical protein
MISAAYSEPALARGARLARRLLPWPVPALLCWAAGWAVCAVLRRQGLPADAAWAVGVALSGGIAWLQASPWRRLMVALGFPLSTALVGLGSAVPAWWLAPLALLVLLYPTRTWRDAPWYPTSSTALQGLGEALPLPPDAQVLDAGCGLGHGLRGLRRHYPQARFDGTEWSVALSALTRLLCPWATVRRGDMWADDWAAYDLVYLFQRPESMPRAVAKARAQMRPGTWLVSMAFEAPELEPHAVLRTVATRPVWLYRMAAAEEGHARARLKSARNRADMENINPGRACSGRPRRQA